MFERYTERARRVLFFARYECSQLSSLAIEPEHVLLGLIREKGGVILRVFMSVSVEPAALRAEVEQTLVPLEKVSTSVEIPFSPSCKRVLQHATEEATGLGHNYIGTEHLLLGLLREEDSAACKVLTGHGLALEATRQKISELLRGPRIDGPG
jgi:ATP-dependent Clp protease ATP-binding subunit ClpC